MNYIYPLLILSFWAETLFAQGKTSWRFGVGTGYSFYYGTQMDYTLTSNFEGQTEFRNTKKLAFYRQVSSKWEWGLSAKTGSVFTMKSQNTQGLEASFDEFSFQMQRNLKGDIFLDKGPFCMNAEFGLGVMRYSGHYFTYDSLNKFQDITSIGYGATGNPEAFTPDKGFALTGLIGLNFGFKITPNFALYLENNLNLTTANLPGNGYRKWFIPPDSYWYSGIALYYRPKFKTYCPRFY
ncbi:hypothetical protein MASR2M44_28330 [Bacteroidota bacterium]